MAAPDLLLSAIAIPFAAALVMSAASMPSYIKALKKHEIQQYLREEGPESHAHKARTPTAGGVMFIIAFTLVVISWYTWEGEFSAVPLLVIAVALICGAVGFFDDFAKIKQKKNEGISAKLRLGTELAVGALLGGVICLTNPDVAKIYVTAGIPALAVAVPIFVVMSSFLVGATTNALNLHDGMDGLAGGTSFLVLMTLAIMLAAMNMAMLATIAATAAGAILGFLVYNKNPAKIFMGDTGSLFIGGLIGALVIASGTLLYFIPLAAIYIVETLSVILQVSYFKLSKPYTPEKPMSPPALAVYKLTHRLPGDGKRLFRMAPLHHHFEAVLAEKGVKEWQVVARFWVAQAILCGIVLVVFFATRSHAP